MKNGNAGKHNLIVTDCAKPPWKILTCFPPISSPQEDTLSFVLANAWCAVVAMVIISCNELVL